MARHDFNEAANVLLTRVRNPSALKSWGLKVLKRRGSKRAQVPLKLFARDIAELRVHCLASILILMAMFLAGCADHQSLDPQKKEEKAAAAQAEKATASIDDARCQSFGYQPGSPGYAQCRKDLDNEHKQFGINIKE